jgi:hypothetical protein
MNSYASSTFKDANNNIKPILLKNDLFRIEFDLPTPRSHFIILLNRDNHFLISNKKVPKESINNLNELEIRSLFDLIDKFKKNTNNNLGDFLLSFHTGKWVSL